MGLELDLGQLSYVGAEEELQQRGVSEHVGLGGEGLEPVRERRLPAVGEAVELAPAAVWLLLLGQVARAGGGGGLRVELGVGQGPELPDRARGHLLEVVRGRLS